MRKLLILLMLLPFVAEAQLLSTRSNIKSSAQFRLRFEKATTDTMFCADSIWNEFVNDACMRVAEDCGAIRGQKKITTAANDITYSIDTTLINILSVMRVRNGAMIPVKQLPPAFMIDLRLDTILYNAAPLSYWINGDSLNFYPIPDKIDTFLVGYSRKPKYLSADSMTTDIPSKYREALPVYVGYLYLWRVKAYDEADKWLTRYNGLIADYRQKYTPMYDIAGSGAK